MAMVELEPLVEEEEVNASFYHHAGDLDGHGRVEIMSDMTRYDAARLHILIARHARFCGSRRAAHILEQWDDMLPKFRKVMPLEYRRALRELEGAGGDAGCGTVCALAVRAAETQDGMGKVTGFSNSSATTATTSRSSSASGIGANSCCRCRRRRRASRRRAAWIAASRIATPAAR